MTWQAGTPLYQSPEQLSKSSGEVNEKVDVYAAGLILFELCCIFST
jgi:serine/threonine protein kinase